jgi:CRISPR type III-B/RAMP module RAMP protein Cmr6
MSKDTENVLGANAWQCDSRSLLLDRFVYDCREPKMDEARRLHFAQVCSDSFSSIRTKREVWQRTLNDDRARPADKEKAQRFLNDTEGLAKRTALVTTAEPIKVSASRQQFFELAATDLLYAQLQSRLMVNMAGGVMENAGLLLDRFGLPYIPGSAVKGCARRAALAALREWCEKGQKPGAATADHDNLFKAACQDFDSPAAMLAAIARVFGWCEQDWKDRSDFAWACGTAPQRVRQSAVEKLHQAFGTKIPESLAATPWEALPNFAGSVSFLPAYPLDLGRTRAVEGLPLPVPELGKLELDVVTCHHRDYYAGQLLVATDTEEPNPVVFPAVAPGHVFAFALRPMRGAASGLVMHARNWLQTGLQTFGLGAKTNAGYGWFNDVTENLTKALKEAAARRAIEHQRQQEEEKRRAKEAERLRKAQELKAAMANMTPEQKADYELSQLREDQFRGRLDQFAKREKSEQEAMVRAMRLPADQTGSRRQFWDELKLKAQKGGKPAQIEQAIRQLSKQMFPGKEGKMP